MGGRTDAWLAEGQGRRPVEVLTGDAIWQRVVAQGLRPTRLDEIAHWGFADFVLAQDYDVVSRTTKLRRTGFQAFLDTEEMVIDHLSRYREAKLLP